MTSRLRFSFAAIALTLIVGVGAQSDRRGLDIYWIDVEGGAATLIVTPARESILVDTGWPGPRDAERIRQVAVDVAGLDRIDHLVTTHWHRDHMGGVAELVKVLPISRFYDHGFPEGHPRDILPELKAAYLDVTKGQSTVLRPGDTLSLRQADAAPTLAVRVLTSHGVVSGETADAAQTRACTASPEHAAKANDESDNYRSVGVVVQFGAFEFLDLGDLTWNVEHKLVCPRNLAGVVDVYQVTHHGLDSSNNPALLSAASPTVAIVNNGPRKGGNASTYRVLKQTPSVKDIFQVHRNVATSADENAPANLVANDDEDCKAEFIHLRVNEHAREYVVEVPAKKTTRSYAVK